MPSSGRPSHVRNLALLHDQQVGIGIERKRPLLMIGGLVVIVARQVERGKYTVHIRIVLVEGQCDVQFLRNELQGRVAIRAPAVNPALAEHAGLPGMGMGIIRVERDGPVEEALRLLIGLSY